MTNIPTTDTSLQSKYAHAQNKLNTHLKDPIKTTKPELKNIEVAIERMKKKKPAKKKPALSDLHQFLLTNHHSLQGLNSNELMRVITEKFMAVPGGKVQDDVDEALIKLKKFYNKKSYTNS